VKDEHQGLSLHLDPAAMRPFIADVVTEVMRRVEEQRATLPDGLLAYSEEAAARMIGLEPHQLRDERRRKRISASQIVGRRIRCTTADLVEYLMRNRVVGDD
jgi:hypothetical protein